MLTIYIDADASPVVKTVLSMREELKARVVLVHSRSHLRREPLPEDVQVIIVESGPDAADYEIAGRARRGDIVITDDLGLAGIVLSGGAVVVNSSGKLIQHQEMDLLLEIRHAAQKERRRGKYRSGPAKRTIEDEKAFAVSLRKAAADCT
ncbi:MAG: YaiI/YqxD family protein [Alkalicoccus sp.]|nr:MAG: YaiI/YqxD family protein [Alkalicoccus sp.]